MSTKLYRPVGNKTLWPIGSVYLSVSSKSPATLFGGTWVQVSGYYLYADSANAKSTGGSWTSGSTTLTANQSGLREHAHTMPGHTFNWGATAPSNNVFQNVGDIQAGITPGNALYTSQGNWNHTDANGGWNATEGHTHSIQPPYFKVYMWYRTA